MPALDPGRGIFRVKSPPPLSPKDSATRVRSPSPPKARTPVKVPARQETLSKAEESLTSLETTQVSKSPEPTMNNGKQQNGVAGKSIANGAHISDVKLPGHSTNQTDAMDDQGLTRKKVVKVVRRVVRKVLPTDEDDKIVTMPAAVSKTPSIPGFSFKHDVVKTEERDDISRGLTNLMVRGRTREPRPRVRHDERPEKLELERKNDKMEERVEQKETKEEDKSTVKPQEVKNKLTDPGPATQGLKSNVNTANTTPVSPTSAPSTSPHSRPSSSEVAPNRFSKSFNSFLPPVSPTKTTPTNPPRPPSSVAQKATALSPPPRFIPLSKPPQVSNPPCPSPASFAPRVPPVQQPAVSHQEVESRVLTWHAVAV